MLSKLTFPALATALLAAPLAAQGSFNGNLGAPLAMGDDAISTQALPFPFTFPDGTTTVNSIDIDSNGRVLPPGGASDYTETVTEFLTGLTAICPLWDDINPADALSDDVYFYADPTVAVITWNNVVIYGGTAPFTFQCQLFPNDQIVFCYDSRVPAEDGLVGLSAGAGAADPGTSDLTALNPLVTTGTTYYELFGTSNNFDLQNMCADNLPTSGTWVVLLGGAGQAGTVTLEPGTPQSLELLPDGSGGYITQPSYSMEPNFGTSIGLVGDDVVSGPQPLGFSFTMPGGTIVTDVEITSNGRILQPGTGEAADYTSSVAEFLADPVAAICPFWTDFNMATTGEVRVNANPAEFTVTWVDVVQYNGVIPHTFQATLRVDGSMRFAYIDLAGFSPTTGLGNGPNQLIGVTPGNGAVDPGPTDFSAGPAAGGSTMYEYFDAVSVGAVNDFRFSAVATSDPVLGQNFDVHLEGVPSSAVQAYMLIGFQNIAAPLGVLGLPGSTLYPNPIAPAIPLTITGTTTNALSLAIPNQPATFTGLTLVLQGVVVVPPSGPGLPIVLSSGIEGTIGS